MVLKPWLNAAFDTRLIPAYMHCVATIAINGFCPSKLNPTIVVFTLREGEKLSKERERERKTERQRTLQQGFKVYIVHFL